MNLREWKPQSFEDRLLHAYLDDHPGLLFLEVRVGGSDDPLAARRIDGVLVPGSERQVFAPQDYSIDQLPQTIDGREIHLIEAKRTLNRNVYGQVLAGSALFQREFDPARVRHVALCSAGEPDLEWVCEAQGVEVALYPISAPIEGSPPAEMEDTPERTDVRSDPDKARRRAFLRGWTDAVNGKLYGSVRERKTHTNMGNLFGWIYGDQDLDFRLETWDRYTDQLS